MNHLLVLCIYTGLFSLFLLVSSHVIVTVMRSEAKTNKTKAYSFINKITENLTKA